MATIVLHALEERFPSAIMRTESHVGDETALVRREHLIEVLAFLRDDAAMAFEMLTDLTVVDYLGQAPRFEVAYQLYSFAHKHRVRVKVPIRDAQAECWVPSVCSLWHAANWAEREAWDLYGVHFDGHPDLRRILMNDDFVGHPLRKDYPQNARQPLLRRPDAPPTDDLTTRLREDSHDRRWR